GPGAAASLSQRGSPNGSPARRDRPCRPARTTGGLRTDPAGRRRIRRARARRCRRVPRLAALRTAGGKLRTGVRGVLQRRSEERRVGRGGGRGGATVRVGKEVGECW